MYSLLAALGFFFGLIRSLVGLVRLKCPSGLGILAFAVAFFLFASDFYYLRDLRKTLGLPHTLSAVFEDVPAEKLTAAAQYGSGWAFPSSSYLDGKVQGLRISGVAFLFAALVMGFYAVYQLRNEGSPSANSRYDRIWRLDFFLLLLGALLIALLLQSGCSMRVF